MARIIPLVLGIIFVVSVFLPMMPLYCLLSGEAKRRGLVGSAIYHGLAIVGLGLLLIILSRCMF